MVRPAGTSFKDVLGIKDVNTESTQVIDSFSFDKEIYQDIFKSSPAIKSTVAQGDAILKTYPDFAQDLFMSLYKHKPNLLDNDEVKDTHQFNHQLMDEMMQMDEFKKLRNMTRLDMINSALGMESLGQEAVNILKVYEEQFKQQNNGQSPFDQTNQQVAGDIGQGNGSDVPGQGSGDKLKAKGQGKLTPEQAEMLANQSAQNNADPMQQLKDNMQQAAKNALDNVGEVSEFLSAWGMDGGDPNNRITFEDKKRALQRLRKSPKLKALTELIGRMKKLAINEQKQKAPEGAESIKSVKTGNDINAILPSERALLASSNKVLKRGFYRKFFDKELLQYDMDVYESMGKGPMIVCMDVSSSMNGEEDRWSKAVGLALLEICQKQKRNYACMHYNTDVARIWEIPYGQLRPDDVFDIAEKFDGGGTNFERPLAKCIDIMENAKFKKGDIVFITDGESSVREEFLKRFKEAQKEKEFKVHSILINMGGGGSIATLERFSDRVLKVSSLVDGASATAKDIFRNV